MKIEIIEKIFTDIIIPLIAGFIGGNFAIKIKSQKKQSKNTMKINNSENNGGTIINGNNNK